MTALTERHAAVAPRARAASRIARWRAVIARWSRRARERAELARLSERELSDIALTRCQVQHEIAKPFWRE